METEYDAAELNLEIMQQGEDFLKEFRTFLTVTNSEISVTAKGEIQIELLKERTINQHNQKMLFTGFINQYSV